MQQVISSIRAHGFAPHTLKPSRNPHAFSIAVKTYLRSGFPVVLLLQDGNDHHAVTALGYREPPPEHQDTRYIVEEDKHKFVSSGMARVYVHEDRLGPYARMNWLVSPTSADTLDELVDSNNEKGDGAGVIHDGVLLQHDPYDGASYTYGSAKLPVYAAIIPLYPKLRLSALGLMKGAVELLPMLRLWGLDLARIRIEMRFQLSGAYLRDMQTLPLPHEGDASPFAMQAVLPRYVGVARFQHGDDAFLDAVFDTTDVLRADPCYSRLLALVALTENYRESVRAFVRKEVPHAIGF